MKQFIITFLISLFSQVSISQVEVSGLVKDSNGPVAYAAVVLKDSTNKNVVFDITDDLGAFMMTTEKGNYTMEIAMLGYQDWTKEIVLDENQVFDDILLESSAQELTEIVVKHKVPLIEQRADRLIFNVANSVAASGGDAVDALRAAPGLNVGTDAISMIGRGAAGVMINGRILRLSGEELISFLNSISANDIQKIEIITNPPAKYDASGGGGLINIVYKKGIKESWKNSSTISYNQNEYNYLSLRNNFSYKKNKLRFNLSLSGNKGDRNEFVSIETDYPSGLWDQKENRKRQMDNLSGRFALDYDLTKNTSIGVQYLGVYREPDKEVSSITNVFDNAHSLDFVLDNIGFDNSAISSNSYNLHLVSRLDTLGRSISFDFDYFNYKNDLNRDFVVNTLSPNGEFLDINQAAINTLDQSIDNFSGKVDVEHPLKIMNFSYGAKLSFSKTLNDFVSFNTITGVPVFDPGVSNEFEYEENVQAVYVNASKKLTSKLEMQIGLRLENTETKGFSKTEDETNVNDYLKLFPTFYVAWQKNRNSNYSFSYGRRINRPYFSDLNPFRYFFNSNSYSEGNPFLQPSFSDNFNFYYIYKRKFTTDIYFNTVSDGFGTIFAPDVVNNTQVAIRRNFITEYTGGIGQIYSENITPWFYSRNQIYLIGYDSKFKENINAEPEFGYQLYLSTSNTITLSGSTRLQIDFNYFSPHRYSLYDYAERYTLSIGIRQQFFSRKLQIAFLAHDIFDRGSLRSAVSEVNGIKTDFGNNYSNRFLRLSLTYEFGNNKINVRNRNFGNDSERRRSN